MGTDSSLSGRKHRSGGCEWLGASIVVYITAEGETRSKILSLHFFILYRLLWKLILLAFCSLQLFIVSNSGIFLILNRLVSS